MSGQGGQDQGNKNEPPTQKKLNDARNEGQVAYSKDLSETIIFIGLFSTILIFSKDIFFGIGEYFDVIIKWMNYPFEEVLLIVGKQIIYDAIGSFCLFIVLLIFLILFADIMQVGFHISPKALEPSFKKMNVVENFKNIFSKKSLVEVLKSIAKISLIAILMAMILSSYLDVIVHLVYSNIYKVGEVFYILVRVFVIIVAASYAVISAIDVIWQKLHLKKKLMMSKDEIKKEAKETEGDPQIKQKRKKLHRSLLNDQIQKTKQSSTLIVNPDHIAVALYYDEEEALPMLTAKATDKIALMMKEAAREAGVPIFENKALARELLLRVEEEEYIPEDLIEPVAEIIAWAREVNSKRNNAK